VIAASSFRRSLWGFEVKFSVALVMYNPVQPYTYMRPAIEDITAHLRLLMGHVAVAFKMRSLKTVGRQCG
jgi:hypothetical protein